MRKSFRIFFFALLAGMAFLNRPAYAGHCTNPPVVELKKPSPDMAIYNACYLDFGDFCVTDTFYQAELHQELIAKFQQYRHSVFGYIDSIHSQVIVDTFYFDTVVFLDTSRREDIWMTIHTQLKGALPVTKFFFQRPKLTYIPNFPLYWTFAGLIDTPFVAFFDNFNSIQEMGVGPEDGCFVEPTAYMLIDNRIHKKGQEQNRMPGISDPILDFLLGVGLNPDSVEIPRVRSRVPPRLRMNGSRISIQRHPEPPGYSVFDYFGSRVPFSRLPSYSISLYDLSGRRLFRQQVDSTDHSFSANTPRLGRGQYLLRVSEKSKTRTKPLIMSEPIGVVDTVHFPR